MSSRCWPSKPASGELVLRKLSAPDPKERYRGAEEALAALTEATGHQIVTETSDTPAT